MTGDETGRRLRSAAILTFLFVPLTWSQTAVRLSGEVRDPAGLPAPGATVIVRHALTGVAQRQVTDQTGRYTFDGLRPGSYRLTATAAGLTEQAVEVELDRADTTRTANLTLALAGLREQVTVVSGSRVEELRTESPAKVEVVTRGQLQETGYERVSDALAEIPGVVTRRGSTAGVAGEQIQGIDSRQAAVLLDGLPLPGARGIKSGVLNLNRQPVGKLERVEVVKGAASALYGSDAIGGVINLITREPSRPFEGDLSVSGGSLSAVDARAGAGGQFRNLSLFLDLERHQQQAYGLIPANPSTVGPHFKRNDLFFKSRYTLGPRAALGFHANAYHNHEVGRALAQTGLAESTFNDSNQNYGLTGDFQLGPATMLQLRGYSARYDENSSVVTLGRDLPPGLANLNERYRRLDATAGHQWGARQFLQFGAEWAQNLYRGANRLVEDNAGQQVTTVDGWFQDRIQLFSRASLSLGGRVQSHSLYGNQVAPKAGLVVRATQRLALRASYGHGFRAPDLGQLYYRFANPAQFYQVIGNPTLRPETSRSYSAGARFTAARFRAGLSFFRNDVRDLIEAYLAGTPRTAADLDALERRYGIPPSFAPLLGRQMFVYLNLNRIYTRGFELDGETSLGKGVRLHGAYTFMDARDQVTGARLTQRHRHHGFVGGEYRNRRLGWLANLRGSLFGSYLLNSQTSARAFGYRIWDLYTSKSLGPRTTVYAAVDNLFDSTDRKLRHATPSFDRPDVGRTFRIGLRYSFATERN
jgi:outer membrane receptor for ferrienterochelin and colicins